MQEVVIIKLYRNAIGCGEYNDLNVDRFQDVVNDIRDFGKSIGKKVLFTICTALNIADFDCFAEIEYNGDITPKEKDFYINTLKEFSKDAEIRGEALYEYSLPLTVVFKKSDIVECC
ncbi:MAG: hypothetical protein ACI4MY_01235 [Christensenellales bacterium]